MDERRRFIQGRIPEYRWNHPAARVIGNPYGGYGCGADNHHAAQRRNKAVSRHHEAEQHQMAHHPRRRQYRVSRKAHVELSVIKPSCILPCPLSLIPTDLGPCLARPKEYIARGLIGSVAFVRGRVSPEIGSVPREEAARSTCGREWVDEVICVEPRQGSGKVLSRSHCIRVAGFPGRISARSRPESRWPATKPMETRQRSEMVLKWEWITESLSTLACHPSSHTKPLSS